MAKAVLKTQAGTASVDDFISAVPDARRREEAQTIDAMLRRVTGMDPKMWGPSIIGYGRYHYKYDSGREGDMCRAGFSPRKAAMTLYLIGHYVEDQAEADRLFAALGKHTTGKSCLYIKRLSDIDLDVLEQLLVLNWRIMNDRYPD